jgi:hypothetical protein
MYVLLLSQFRKKVNNDLGTMIGSEEGLSKWKMFELKGSIARKTGFVHVNKRQGGKGS